MRLADKYGMSSLAEMLSGQEITHVMADSEVTYIMLANGTQVTIRGLVVIEPKQSRPKIGACEESFTL